MTFHGGAAPEDPAAARAAFEEWLSGAGEAVLDTGAPLRVVTQLSAGAPQAPCEIAGYAVIEAASIEAASGLLSSHPFLDRGATLQLNELIADT